MFQAYFKLFLQVKHDELCGSLPELSLFLLPRTTYSELCGVPRPVRALPGLPLPQLNQATLDAEL